MGRNIDREEMVDSKTVFNVTERDEKTGEKRFQIDVLALSQNYDRDEFRRIA